MAKNKASKAAGEAQDEPVQGGIVNVTEGSRGEKGGRSCIAGNLQDGVQPALCRGHDESRGRGGKKGNRGEKNKCRGFRAVKKM